MNTSSESLERGVFASQHVARILLSSADPEVARRANSQRRWALGVLAKWLAGLTLSFGTDLLDSLTPWFLEKVGHRDAKAVCKRRQHLDRNVLAAAFDALNVPCGYI
jgi:hypothetical protein